MLLVQIFLAILDDDTLVALVYTLTTQVVDVVVGRFNIDHFNVLDACSTTSGDFNLRDEEVG